MQGRMCRARIANCSSKASREYIHIHPEYLVGLCIAMAHSSLQERKVYLCTCVPLQLKAVHANHVSPLSRGQHKVSMQHEHTVHTSIRCLSSDAASLPSTCCS
jgi:hypothetical protein